MKPFLLLFAAALSAPAIAHGSEAFEVCTPEGECALRVTDNETGEGVWLVTSEDSPLQSIWKGVYWLVPADEYKSVAELIPDEQRLTLPGINPTTGETMRKGGTPAPAPSRGGGPLGGGPLVTGSISVGNITIGGGDGGCRACHDGSMKEIHKKVLERVN